MGRDSRKFEVQVGKNVGLAWLVLKTVESAVAEAAGEHDRETGQVVSVDHSTGHYRRDTVEDARATAERNGFSVGSVEVTIEQLRPRPKPSYQQSRDQWVFAAARHFPYGVVVIHVMHGTEVEVNGVFAMVQEAVKAAVGSKQSGTNNAVVKPAVSSPVVPAPWWRRALNHPWVVTIVGGAVVSAAFLWLALEMA